MMMLLFIFRTLHRRSTLTLSSLILLMFIFKAVYLAGTFTHIHNSTSSLKLIDDDVKVGDAWGYMHGLDMRLAYVLNNLS